MTKLGKYELWLLWYIMMNLIIDVCYAHPLWYHIWFENANILSSCLNTYCWQCKCLKNIELLRPQMSHTQALLIVWEPCGHVASPRSKLAWDCIHLVYYISSCLSRIAIILLPWDFFVEARNLRNFRKISAALPLVFWTPENFRIHRTCYLWKKNTSYIPRYPTTTPYQSNTFPWHF